MLSTISSLPPANEREYYFRRDGRECTQPSTERHSNSQAMGTVTNANGDWWEKTAENVVNVAKIAGNLVKLVLKPSIQPNKLDYIVYYDEISSAKKFHDHIDSLKLLGEVPITCNSHQETPRTQ